MLPLKLSVKVDLPYAQRVWADQRGTQSMFWLCFNARRRLGDFNGCGEASGEIEQT